MFDFKYQLSEVEEIEISKYYLGRNITEDGLGGELLEDIRKVYALQDYHIDDEEERKLEISISESIREKKNLKLKYNDYILEFRLDEDGNIEQIYTEEDDN